MPHDLEEKDRHADDITAPEAGRLLQEAKDPLQAERTHHAGRTRNGSGYEIEQSAHGQDKARMLRPDMVRHPFFLQRRAHSDDEDIELLPFDLRCNGAAVDL